MSTYLCAGALGTLLSQAQRLGNGNASVLTLASDPGSADNPLASSLSPASDPIIPTTPIPPDILPVPPDPTHLTTDQLPPSTDPLPISQPAEPPTAAPLPPPPTVDAVLEGREIRLTFGDRHYRVRGLHKALSYDQLKINLLVARADRVHIDTFDLYAARPRQAFIQQAASELGLAADLLKKDLGQILLKLEALQDDQIQQALTPKPAIPTLTAEEQQHALALLQDPRLLDQILEDFTAAGVVGEETNKLMGYLACVSRKLDKPLALIIQSSSAAGKSSLMDAILHWMPEEEQVHYSAMTGQSLFYMGETHLKHKILAIAEEEGAQHASYALKFLQSEGELTIASTGKDESTGTLVTKEYRVEGPVMLFLTTTAIDIDEELMNRCVVLTVNESRAQTQAIHAIQRQQQTLAGLLRQDDKKRLSHRHRNAQRLLKPLLVANPFAEQLTFLDDKTRTRRDHMKYLTLIRAIALLHQYQRDVKTVTHHGQVLHYIEVTPADIELANHLAHEVLGRTLDELPPQTRQLLGHIHRLVKDACQQQQIEPSDYRFSRKTIREATGWGQTQLKVHLKRLEDLEYLLIHRGGRGQSFVYELLYRGEGEQRARFLPGLIDVDRLAYDAHRSGLSSEPSGEEADLAGSSRGQVGVKSGSGRPDDNPKSPDVTDASDTTSAIYPKNAYLAEPLPVSHRSAIDRPVTWEA